MKKILLILSLSLFLTLSFVYAQEISAGIRVNMFFMGGVTIPQFGPVVEIGISNFSVRASYIFGSIMGASFSSIEIFALYNLSIEPIKLYAGGGAEFLSINIPDYGSGTFPFLALVGGVKYTVIQILSIFADFKYSLSPQDPSFGFYSIGFGALYKF
ncbi:MAG: hypothetical protein N2312_05255 [Dictyoglomaceae bacterium]|nr:hypothetical protein [Dictyoglomaceae bacterium]